MGSDPFVNGGLPGVAVDSAVGDVVLIVWAVDEFAAVAVGPVATGGFTDVLTCSPSRLPG